MPAPIVKTIVTLAVVSLVVGLLMGVFGIDPEDIYHVVSARIGDAFTGLTQAIGWAWGYIVLGAVVVVPVWLIIKLLGRWRRS
ncbi:MAG: integrase [Hyphomicrobiales bacterium]|nr:integrase [Hyphomicrobiales bacterium]